MNVIPQKRRKYKSRLIIQKGSEYTMIGVEHIAMLYIQNRVVFVVDRAQKKHITSKNLNQLEQELNPDMFFRANRQCIININFVRSFKTYDRVKILLELSLEDASPIIISQDNAAAFRKWITEEW